MGTEKRKRWTRVTTWGDPEYRGNPEAHSGGLIRIMAEMELEPRLGCEVGVWKGDLSEFLLKKLPTLHLLMVDRWREYEEVGSSWSILQSSLENMERALLTAKHRTSFAEDRRSLLISDSLRASEVVGTGSLDFVFIDAGHDYDSVSKDIRAWEPNVRVGGLVCGHDYNSRQGGAVLRAVDEYAEESGCDIQTGKWRERLWWYVKK